MKTSSTIIFLVLAMLKAHAQDYLINFTGTGDTTLVSAVKVSNLTSGDTLTLNGWDILHLTSAGGIDEMNSNNKALKIFPNPMAGQSILTFAAQQNGNAVVSVVDLSGKTICQISTLLSHGANRFRISGINQGMYLVRVNEENYIYSTKLISQNNLQSEAIIESIPAVKNTLGNFLKSSEATVDMPYTDGDQLLFKGISGIYSTLVPDIPVSNKTITFNFLACTDADNNNYPIVQISSQVWMAENLNVGVQINGAQGQTNNGIIEKYCYNDDDSLCDIYGGLYQWDEMMQGSLTPGVQGICPTGWHLPIDAEWTTLTDYLGGISIAGGKLKATTLWASPNTGADNSSGFNALPGGYRDAGSGGYNHLGFYGYWWTSTRGPAAGGWFRCLHYDLSDYCRFVDAESYGYSVRCVRNL